MLSFETEILIEILLPHCWGSTIIIE